MTIYKYPLEQRHYQEVEMPRGARVIACQTQDDVPTLWALVDSYAQPVRRLFRIVGTGSSFLDPSRELKYVGTFQKKNGNVWHVFEKVGGP